MPAHRFSKVGFAPFFLLAVFLQATADADPRAPLPATAFDGGVVSAEALGRGNTFAAMPGSPASGSLNPAALAAGIPGGFYATALVDMDSDLPEEAALAPDPLSGKVLQYLSIGADKGVIFFQPLGRLSERQPLDAAAPSGDFRRVSLAANAIGFAGATRMKRGTMGLSLAYLWSALSVQENRGGQAADATFATQNGVQMNLGFMIPTGPAAWGLVLQNAPGFLWSSKFKRELLPVSVRVGNSWNAGHGFRLAVDTERRFYNEGADDEDFLYIGSELVSGSLVLRAGVHGTDVGKPEERRTTAGLSYAAQSGATLTYAFETFEENDERVRRSLVSIQAPFQPN